MAERLLPPIGFWSYARPDDELSGGQLSRLRSLIRSELQQQYGREPIQLFQDISAISHGSRWEGEIRRALENSTFFIPILSPNFLQSDWCVQEVEIFQERQERLFDEFPDLPRTSRIFPIQYIDSAGIESTKPGVDQALAELQWFDFREFRHADFAGAEVRRHVAGFVTSVRDLLRVQVEQPGGAQVSQLVAKSVQITVLPSAATQEPGVALVKPETSPSIGLEPEAGSGGGGGRIALVGGGVIALLVTAALIYFLVLQRDPAPVPSATNQVAAAAAPPANVANATEPADEAANEADAVSADLLAARWGDNDACTGRVWAMNADGTHVEDGVSGGWALADGVLTVTAGGAAVDLRVQLAGEAAETMTLTPVDPSDGIPQTWYRCPA